MSHLNHPSSIRNHKSPRGFTLVELLVVITIIGILIALLLPAVQAAREAARRLQCQNNLKQLSLGCLNHEQLHKYLPSGGWGFCWVGTPDFGVGKNQTGGWTYSILPFIEQQALFDLGADGNTRDPVTQTQKQGAMKRDMTPLAVFICPTRRTAILYPRPYGLTGAAKNSLPHSEEASVDYASNAGSDSTFRQCYGPDTLAGAATYPWSACGALTDDGVIYSRSETRMADITDGASNTILLGEKYLMSDHYYDGLEATDDGGAFQGHSADVAKHAAVVFPPMQDRDGYAYYYAFGSAHANGCHFAFCDGSVQQINYSIDPIVYSRLGSRKDGRPIDGNDY